LDRIFLQESAGFLQESAQSTSQIRPPNPAVTPQNRVVWSIPERNLRAPGLPSSPPSARRSERAPWPGTRTWCGWRRRRWGSSRKNRRSCS